MQLLLKPWYLFRPEQIIKRLRLGSNPPLGVKKIETSWGGEMEIDTQRLIGRYIDTTGLFDLAVSEAILRLSKPSDKVVDVGGNIGHMALLLALNVSPGGELTVFEPHPAIFQQLSRNFSLNQPRIKLQKLNLVQAAVGASTGTATLVLPEDFNVNDGTAHLAEDKDGANGIEVKVTTLDAVFPQDTIQLMKMDVEGHELAALKGAEKLFSDHRVRHLIFEANDGADSPVCHQLQAWGYDIQRLGWSLTHLTLAPLSAPPIHKPYESPSFIASIAPAEVKAAFAASGWKSLRPITGY